jgi:hypothetical protein
MAVGHTAHQRRKRNRRRRWQAPTASLKQVITSARWMSLILFAVCAYAVFLVGSVDDFYLTYIPVEGVTSITPEEIVAASGLAGRHVFAANPEAAAAAINAIPGVVSATVKLSWPNEVSIKVAEDTPIMVWERNGTPYWVTSQGAVVPARQELAGLLVVRTETAQPVVQMVNGFVADTAFVAMPEPAENADSVMPIVAPDVLEGALQLRTLRPELTTLTFDPAGGLSFSDDGWPVYFGTGSDMHQKMVVYRAIVADLEAEGMTPTYISVANQDKPFYQAFGQAN